MNKLFVGSGVYGKCYLNNNFVIKEYCDLKNFPYQQKAFIGLENDTYVFPNDIEFLDDKINVIMNAVFYDKTNIVAKPLILQNNVSFENIVSSIDKAYLDTDKLSNDTKIITSDVHTYNILFTGNMIKVVDTDMYDFSVKSLEEVKKINIINLNNGLLDSIIGTINKYGLIVRDYNLINYILKDDRLTNLYFRLIKKSEKYDNKFLKEFLIELKKHLEINYNSSINTTFDIKRVLIK